MLKSMGECQCQCFTLSCSDPSVKFSNSVICSLVRTQAWALPSCHIALGRVTAHEFGHIFLGSGHVGDDDPMNLMGTHTFGETYDPKGGEFALD
jgi:hypothetical protein